MSRPFRCVLGKRLTTANFKPLEPLAAPAHTGLLSTPSSQRAVTAAATAPKSNGFLSPLDIPSPQIPLPDNAKTLTLPDGRKMGYAEYGPPSGHPFIFVHGIPDCRINCCPTAWESAIAHRLNVRWIGIDRPGIGLSTPQPNRTIADWPEDVKHLIHHLGLSTYRVFGVSGGTAYALACARQLPRDQLLGVGIMAGMGPAASGLRGMSLTNRAGMLMWKYTPWLMEGILNRSLVPALMDPDPAKTEALFRKQAKLLEGIDKDFFSNKETAPILTTILKEAYRQGSAAGHAQDTRLADGDWGFELESVTHGNVKLWYGLDDVNTPVEQGRYLAARIPGSVMTEYEGKTHFGIWDHLEEALASMLEDE